MLLTPAGQATSEPPAPQNSASTATPAPPVGKRQIGASSSCSLQPHAGREPGKRALVLIPRERAVAAVGPEGGTALRTLRGKGVFSPASALPAAARRAGSFAAWSLGETAINFVLGHKTCWS